MSQGCADLLSDNLATELRTQMRAAQTVLAPLGADQISHAADVLFCKRVPALHFRLVSQVPPQQPWQKLGARWHLSSPSRELLRMAQTILCRAREILTSCFRSRRPSASSPDCEPPRHCAFALAYADGLWYIVLGWVNGPGLAVSQSTRPRNVSSLIRETLGANSSFSYSVA